MHDFKDRLDFSWRYADAPWWFHVYREALPGFESWADIRNKGQGQKDGIDRVVVLNNGQSLNIDEKVRESFYGWDVLLEYEHRGPRYNDIGWIKKDLRCDYIAYAWVPRHAAILLPWLPLKRAWSKHGEHWIKLGDRESGIYNPLFATKSAPNDGYRTHFVCVPLTVLRPALTEAMTVIWPQSLPSGGVAYSCEVDDLSEMPDPHKDPSAEQLRQMALFA